LIIKRPKGERTVKVAPRNDGNALIDEVCRLNDLQPSCRIDRQNLGNLKHEVRMRVSGQRQILSIVEHIRRQGFEILKLVYFQMFNQCTKAESLHFCLAFVYALLAVVRVI
jgi:hypothetical protein